MHGRLARFGAFPSFEPVTPRLGRIWRPGLLLDLAMTIAVLFLVLSFVTPARAQNPQYTIFLTDRNGQIKFPILPPNFATGAPGSIDNMSVGANTAAPGKFSTLTLKQAAPDAEVGTGTLTAAAVTNGIINGTPVAAAAYTLPLATAMDTALPTYVANDSLDFTVINTSAGANTITMTTNTGWTLVGTMTIAQNVSGRFRARKTGAGAWVLYRIS